MSIDLVEIALGRFTDWAAFEKLASEVMRSEGYPDIKPLGGSRDSGQDAIVERLYSSEGKRMRVVFQYTLRTDVTAKMQETIKRLDASGVVFQKLVIVTPAQISTETQQAIIRKAAHEHEVDLEFYDRRTLVNRLADFGNGIFYRCFPDINRQVAELLRSRPGAKAHQDREREFLKICCAFTFSPRIQRTRKSLLDEATLAILLQGARPMTTEEILGVAREALKAEALHDPGQVEASLDRLVRRESATKEGSAFRAREEELARLEAATISLEATQGSAISDIVTDVCIAAKEPIGDAIRARLEANAHEVLVEYFRMNGLELSQFFLSGEQAGLVYSKGTPRLLEIARNGVPAHLGDLLVTAIGRALCTPSLAQAEYFAACSRGYIALQVMNVDPALREFQATRFKTKVFIVDTDVVLAAIVHDLPSSETYRRLIRQLVQFGARVLVPEEVIGEVVTHLSIAPQTYDYFGPVLPFLSEELASTEIWNAVVSGYWYYSRRQGWANRADFLRYWGNYYDAKQPGAFIADVIRETLTDVAMHDIALALGVSITREEYDTAVSTLMEVMEGTRKAAHRTEEQKRGLAKQDATLMLAVEKYNQSVGKVEKALLGKKAYLLSSSGRYVRATEKLKLDPQLAARPHIVIALLEMIGPSSVGDRELVALFENPLLQQAVGACWDNIKVLLDAGLDLTDKSITRLRCDVERRLHDRISSLRNADAAADEGDREGSGAGDKEHLAVLDEAEALGYRPMPLLARLREEGKLKEGEIDRLVEENKELREAVTRFGRRKARWLRRWDRSKEGH